LLRSNKQLKSNFESSSLNVIWFAPFENANSRMINLLNIYFQNKLMFEPRKRFNTYERTSIRKCFLTTCSRLWPLKLEHFPNQRTDSYIRRISDRVLFLTFRETRRFNNVSGRFRNIAENVFVTKRFITDSVTWLSFV